MPNIDDRVVSMQFDNKEFDPKLKKSQKTFEEFEESLSFDKGSKALKNFEKNMDKFDTKPMSDKLGALGKSFSAFETISVGALLSVGNRLENFINRALKMTLTEGATKGWGDYAEKVTAVQTIMAATASQFEDTSTQIAVVNSQLDDLRTFSDETSFSFKEMTSNIGKFTSQGIDLRTSVRAMEGISTWAALSGANTWEASRAYYNLSQALGTGAVTLVDWKSIENANMATVEFKQTALDTAVAMGTLKKQADGTYKTLQNHAVSVANFNQNLSDRWLTSNVLLKSLDRYGGFAKEILEYTNELSGISVRQAMRWIDDYAEGTLDLDAVLKSVGDDAEQVEEMITKLGAKEYDLGRRAFRAAQETKTFAEALAYTKEAIATGWSQTWELIFGDYTDARKFWTDITDDLYEIFITGGEFRNEVLELWSKTVGRKDFVEGINALRDAFYTLRDAVREGIKVVFPFYKDANAVANVLVDLTKRFKEWAISLKANEEQQQKIKDVVSDVARLFKFFVTVLRSVKLIYAPIIDEIKQLLNVFKPLFSSIHSGIQDLTESKNVLLAIRVAFYYIGKALALPIKLVNAFINLLRQLSGMKLPELKTYFSDLGKRILTVLGNLARSVATAGFNIVRGFWTGFSTAWRSVSKAISTAFSLLVDQVKRILKIHSPSKVFEEIGSNTATGYFNGIKKSWSGGGRVIKEKIDELGTVFKSGSSFAEIFSTSLTVLGETLIWLVKVAYQVIKAFLILKLMATALTSFTRVVSAIGQLAKAIPYFITTIADAAYNFTKARVIESAAKVISSIAISIAILVGSFVLLATIKLRDIRQAISIMTYIVTILAVFIGLLIAMTKILGKESDVIMRGISRTLISFAVGVLVMTVLLRAIVNLIKKVNYDYSALYIAIGTMVAIMLITIGIIALLTQVLKIFNKNIKNITKIMVTMALHVAMFFASLLLIGYLYRLLMGALPSVVAAFTVFVILTAVVTSILKKVAKKEEVLLKGLKALSKIIGSIVGFLAAMLLITVISKFISINSLMHAALILVLSEMLVSVLMKVANKGTKELVKDGIGQLIIMALLLDIFISIFALSVLRSALISIEAIAHAILVLTVSETLVAVLVKLASEGTKELNANGILRLIASIALINVFVAGIDLLVALTSLISVNSLLQAGVILALSVMLIGVIGALSSYASDINLSGLGKLIAISLSLFVAITFLVGALALISLVKDIGTQLQGLISIAISMFGIILLFGILAAMLDAADTDLSMIMSVVFLLVAVTAAISIISTLVTKLAQIKDIEKGIDALIKLSIVMTVLFTIFTVLAVVLDATGLGVKALLAISFALIVMAATFATVVAVGAVGIALFVALANLIVKNEDAILRGMQILVSALTTEGIYIAMLNMLLFGLAATVFGAGVIVLAAGLLLLAPALMLLNLALPAFQNFVGFMRKFIGWDLVGKAGEFLLFAGIIALSAILLKAVPILFLEIAASLFALALAFKYVGNNFEIINKGLELFNVASWKFVGRAALFSLAMLILSIGLAALAVPLVAVTVGVSSLIRAVSSLINAIANLAGQSDKLESFFKSFADNVHYVVAGIVALGSSLGGISPSLTKFADAVGNIASALFGLAISMILIGAALIVVAIGFGLVVLILFLFEKVLDDIKDKHPRLYEAIMQIVEALSKAIAKAAEAPQSFEDSGKEFVAALSGFVGDIELVAHGVGMALEGLGALVQGLGEGLGSALKGAGEGLGKWLSGSKKEREQLIELARVQTDLSNAQARNSEATAKVVTETNKLNDTLSMLPSSGSGNKVFAFLEKLAEKIKELGDICKTYYVSISNTRNGINSFFKQLSENAINEYISALTKANARVKMAAQEVGMNCARGLNLGLKSNTTLAASAASALGSATIAALRKSVDAHSPARKFEEIGGDEIDGNVDGINKNKYKVVSAAEGMGDAVVNASKSAADRIVEAYEEAFDTIELRAKKTRFDELDKKLKTKGQTLSKDEWAEYFSLQNDISLMKANKKYLELSKDAREEEKARVKAERRAKNEEKETKSFKETLSAVGTDLKDIVSAVKNGDITIGEGFSRGWNSIKTNLGGYLGDKFSGIFSGDVLSNIKKTLGLDNIFGGAGLDLESLMPKPEDMKDPYEGIDTNFGSGSDLSGLDNVSGSGQGTINTYEFVQNNYSPKALSRIEIYRQTNRQFNNFRTREVLAR